MGDLHFEGVNAEGQIDSVQYPLTPFDRKELSRLSNLFTPAALSVRLAVSDFVFKINTCTVSGYLDPVSIIFNDKSR